MKIILKEIGLDPGFDHISAMQIISNVKIIEMSGKDIANHTWHGWIFSAR